MRIECHLLKPRTHLAPIASEIRARMDESRFGVRIRSYSTVSVLEPTYK